MADILIIEDDPDMAEMMSVTLAIAKHKVEICGNGKDGFDKAQKTPPDLVVLDVMLPDMHGYQICRKLKGSDATKNLKVLFVTAKVYQVEENAAQVVGGDGFLTKPFLPATLVDTVARLLGQSEGVS